MLVLVPEYFKANSMTINFSYKSHDLAIASFIIEKHRLSKKISRILEIVHRYQEQEVAFYERVIIFKYIHAYTIGNTDIDRKIEYESTEYIILLRSTELVSFIYFIEDFLIHAITDNSTGILRASDYLSGNKTVLRTKEKYYERQSEKPCTQKDNIGDSSKHTLMIQKPYEKQDSLESFIMSILRYN